MRDKAGFMGQMLALSLSLTLAGCATSGAGKMGQQDAMGRANPGYVQWLERQSMLRQTPDLTSIVSGSTLAWRAPAADNNAVSLLRIADVWFTLSPRHTAWSGNASALATLRSRHMPEQLAALGMDGIILNPMAESGADWNAEDSFAEQGHDIVNFRFSSGVGTEEEYAALEQTSVAGKEGGFLIGSGVLPAATGLGPDFFLALRGVRDYPGLYIMVEAPQDVWKILPLSHLPGEEGNTVGRAISPEVTEVLTTAGILPPAFSRDAAHAGLLPSGWAATSEIAGVDGVNRRWIYRWSGSPRRPVLNWDDPSGAAQRLLAASVIKQVGQLRQPLVALSIEALWGQETDQGMGNSPEPALSALRALSRDVRRYGAWSMLHDDLPAEFLPLIQSAGVDFALDSVTSPALEYAMLTADAAPLRQSLQTSLQNKVQHNRLWRRTASGEALHFQRINKSAEPVELNAFSLAATAAGATPDELRSAALAEQAEGQTANTFQQVRDAHLLQVAFRLLQPGLFVLQSHDVAGLLNVPDNYRDSGLAPSEQSAWTIDGSGQTVSKQGIPASPGLYPALDAQAGVVGSFGHTFMGLNTLRRDTGVAEGELVAVPDMGENAAASVLTRLPDGDFLLCAGNFSATAFITDVTIPDAILPANAGALDLVTGKHVALSNGHMRLRMQPWQYRIVRISGQ